ncbi:MAG TPA: hypothetical protein VJU59_13490 [Paraburkholderia sp.]|uniref:hypothetical protein n=1 Tax=Paraburkholderia sp. TaxID=1926495 RepID=UPI002B45C9AB|nr:hypothetical protein [Paraburkholderia sp.]HKR40669.1 hypothetical protein [Paraburkholderia sp.]
MATGTGREFGAIAVTVLQCGAIRPVWLLKITLGWSIALCGMSILTKDASATIAPFFHGVACAIIKAVT